MSSVEILSQKHNLSPRYKIFCDFSVLNVSLQHQFSFRFDIISIMQYLVWLKIVFSLFLYVQASPVVQWIACQAQGSNLRLGKVDSDFHPLSGSVKMRTKHASFQVNPLTMTRKYAAWHTRAYGREGGKQ